MNRYFHTTLTGIGELIYKDSTIFLDTETTGLNKLSDKPFMLLIGVHDLNTQFAALRWSPSVVRWLDTNLPRAKRVICHNAKYDWHMMRNGGVSSNTLYNTNVYCTLVAEVLIDEHRRSYSLDNLGESFFKQGKRGITESIAAFFGLKDSKKAMERIADYAQSGQEQWAEVADYGIQDIRLTEMLYQRQQPLIRQQELERVLELEMNTLKALVEVEFRGVPVDQAKVKEVEASLTIKQREVQKRIISAVGWEVNPRSPIEMTEAFTTLGIPLTTPKGKNRPSFAKDVLDSLDANEYPFIELLRQSRNIKTMMDTFIHGSIGKNMVNGRIHTDFNQVRGDDYGTVTGRLSSSNPNMQQIPKRNGELAPLIRGLYYGGPGRVWIANDWEQFEFRVFAHYVKDIALTDRYRNNPNTDFHTALAEMTGKPRDKAKRINLGLVFGMGEGKLAKELGLPYETTERDGKEVLIAGEEAKALFEEYHSRFPKAKAFLQEASHLAKKRGYIKTLYGRRIRFPGGQLTHKAGGLVFQGTSADLMKRKLCELNDEFRHTATDLVLVVHDEFCLTSPFDQAAGAAKRVKAITEDIPELRIPILADPGIGPNWWEASAG